MERMHSGKVNESPKEGNSKEQMLLGGRWEMWECWAGSRGWRDMGGAW